MVRHGIQQDLALTTGFDLIVLTAALLVPGWFVLPLLGLQTLPPTLAAPASIGAGLAIVSVAAWLAWLSGTGMTGAAVLTLVVIAGAGLARIVWRKRATLIERPGRLELSATAFAALASILAVVSGPWLGQSADSFYHMAAARALLTENRALPQDIFFGIPVPYPDATSGSLHLVLAWLSMVGGMVPAWAALTVFGAALTAVSFTAFAREVTRSTPAALIATLLYFLVGLNLDMRDAGYPDRIGLDLAWLSLAFLLRFARSNGNGWRQLVPVGLLGFASVSVYSGMGPLLVAMVFATLSVAAAVALRRRHLSSVRPLAIACAALMLVILPVLAVRVLAAVPTPGMEASLATHAPPVKVLVLDGYQFVDFRFWFGGSINIITLGTICLLGRARRFLIDGDPGAHLLWGCMLLVPTVGLTPLLTNWPTGLYFLARIDFLLSPLAFVALGWQLSALPASAAAIYASLGSRLAAVKLVAGLLLMCATAYAIADHLPEGVLYRYAGHKAYSVTASRSNNLTIRWADRLRALGKAGPGTILAGWETSYELAGLTGRRVVAVPYGHGPYQDEARDGALRRGDVADALNPSADPTTLLSVLFRYHVTFVVVDLARDGQASWDWIARQRMLTTVAEGSGWKLYRFDLTRVDQALDIPLTGEIGIVPARAIAGRALFVRVKSPGPGATAHVTACGIISGACYQTQFDLPDQAGATITAPLLLPDAAAVDRYALTVSLPGDTPISGGQVEVGRTYEGEYFKGVFFDLLHGYARSPGWEIVGGPAYNRGQAAIALRTESVASHPLLEPPGNYCLSLLVTNTGGEAAHTLDVGLGGDVLTASWAGQSAGIRDLEMAARVGSTSGQLTYWVPAAAPSGVIVDTIALYPPPASGGTCGPTPST